MSIGCFAPALITKDVAARMMGVSVRTVERRIHDGELRVAARERAGHRGPKRTMLSYDEVWRVVHGADPNQLALDI